MRSNVAAKRARKGTEHILPSFERLPWSSKLCAAPWYPLGSGWQYAVGAERIFWDFPGTPLGDGFDASGDLWVTIQLSTTCPQGCVVEFPRAQLAMRDEPDADGHDLFDRRRQHCLLAFRGYVDGHRRRVGLLRHPL